MTKEGRILKGMVLFIFTLGVLIVGVCLWSGSKAYGQAMTLSGSCQDRQCEICDKKLTEWVEYTATFGTSLSWRGSQGYCRGELANSLTIYFDKYYVCHECYSKYNQEYTDLMHRTQKAWLERVIQDNLNRRQVNRDKNKSDALKKLLEEMEQTERKIKELDKVK